MREFKLLLAVCGGVLLFVAGCPSTMPPPPPPPPPPADLGDAVRALLNDGDDADPIDVPDDVEFDPDNETDEFSDVLVDPASA